MVAAVDLVIQGINNEPFNDKEEAKCCPSEHLEGGPGVGLDGAGVVVGHVVLHSVGVRRGQAVHVRGEDGGGARVHVRRQQLEEPPLVRWHKGLGGQGLGARRSRGEEAQGSNPGHHYHQQLLLFAVSHSLQHPVIRI